MNQYEKIKTFLEQAFQQRFEDLNAPLSLHYVPDTKVGNIDLFIADKELDTPVILTLFLTLLPSIHPTLLQDMIKDYVGQRGDAPQIGGVKGKNHRGILPNGEMVLFLLAGDHFENRINFITLFSPEHFLFKEEILEMNLAEPSEPILSAALTVNMQWFSSVVLGHEILPQFSKDFPAQLIETELHWKDLIVSSKTQNAIAEIKNWLEYNEDLLHRFNMKRMLKPGFRSLFFGPPGVGKTLAVTLLGKHIKRPIYRIDLSMVVSKYIGETEKNLASLFRKAENKDWILFFDEADAIFGKRTNVRDAHDKYANQEVSYLLQRMENFNGLVVLATNFKTNLDTAFARRFQSYVEFEMPNAEQRLKLWQNMLPENMDLNPNCDLPSIAEKYAITGANILNVVQYAAIQALKKNVEQPEIFQEDLVFGILKELRKEGKV